MAQTGYTPILIYSSSTVSQAPAAGNLTNSTLGSELAINITDGKLFYKDNANAVQVIGWKTVPTTAGGTGLTSYTAGDLVYYASGTAFTKLAIGASGRYLSSSGTAPQWTAPAALTKTDDTNVTLTLGGSASTALLNAASLTLGWTGTLAVSRGGTGTGTAGITAFNNITGYTATGATGTTSTNLVFSTSPTLVTPNLGTPSALVLTNATGLPQTGLGTNVVGNGPAFSAYRSGTQTINDNTLTKIQFNAEEFDTNNNFDSTTNYRFTPTVAGYYQFTASAVVSAGVAGEFTVWFYKNGGVFKYGNDLTATNTYVIQGAALIYLNGSTDYVEVYVYQNSGGAVNLASSATGNYFQGVLVRSA